MTWRVEAEGTTPAPLMRQHVSLPQCGRCWAWVTPSRLLGLWSPRRRSRTLPPCSAGVSRGCGSWTDAGCPRPLWHGRGRRCRGHHLGCAALPLLCLFLAVTRGLRSASWRPSLLAVMASLPSSPPQCPTVSAPPSWAPPASFLCCGRAVCCWAGRAWRRRQRPDLQRWRGWMPPRPQSSSRRPRSPRTGWPSCLPTLGPPSQSSSQPWSPEHLPRLADGLAAACITLMPAHL